jgi:hypothetical protein
VHAASPQVMTVVDAGGDVVGEEDPQRMLQAGKSTTPVPTGPLVRLGIRGRGPALLDLGDTSRAHLISEGERLLPPARDKTKGVFLACRAASYLDLKEPEPWGRSCPAAFREGRQLATRTGT